MKRKKPKILTFTTKEIEIFKHVNIDAELDKKFGVYSKRKPKVWNPMLGCRI